MRHALNLLSAIPLPALSITAFAQKNKTENDNNLKQADEAPALP